jgi:hypothetical protein
MGLDLSPLLGGMTADGLRVAGVAVGDPAEGINRAALTGGEDKAPDEPRIYAKGTVYRRLADGTEVEVPLSERIDNTLRKGGVLRVGAIALMVKDGVVDRIFVRGPSLATLGIKTESDISRRLGAPDGHSFSFGKREHRYSAKRLTISWDIEDECIAHVELGAAPWVEPKLGARDLLREILDAYPVLDGADWAEPKDGSAKVRHQRIAALGRAFGIGAPASLVRGEFLGEEIAPGRRRVLNELSALSGHDDLPIREHRASTLFTHLLGYRVDAERVVRATSGWLECSDPVLLGMINTQNRIAGQVTALMTDVDRWLCVLLDPEERSFELRELVARHGWPDVDLRQLEIDEY